MRITVEMVIERVEKVRAVAVDDEAAHAAEDALRADLLRAIADGTCIDPQDCARIALTTDDIEFNRWCA